MKQLTFLVIILCAFLNGSAQVLQKPKKPEKTMNQVSNDTSRLSKKNNKAKNDKAKIEQYLIIDNNDHMSYVDTTLTIQKEYKFNYLRKDNFGLLPFANLGQTYNQLTRQFHNSELLPMFGARARHFNYMEVDDIYYFEVPTPLTELFYKSAFQQGQLLDAFFTSNLSKQFNFSLAYKGLRSLGNYQHQVTSTGNLRFTTYFKTKNGKYNLKAHFVTQDLLNEENGGLTDDDVLNFISGNEDFLDRSVFDPNFQDAENTLVGKRFYLNQEYQIISPTDSVSNRLSLRNIINFEDKFFEFRQNTRNDIFGEAFNQQNIRNRSTLESFNSSIFLEYEAEFIGDVSLGLNYYDINYGYDKVTILDNEIIPNRIKDQIISVEGSYRKRFGPMRLKSNLGINVVGEFEGNYVNASLDYTINDDLELGASLNVNSAAPNYNVLLHQSDYINYNWRNYDFDNQKFYDLGFHLKSSKYLDLSVDYSSMDNFIFFSKNLETDLVRPFQLEESIELLKIRAGKEFKLGKFALDNTLLYQLITDDSESLNLPEIVLRNTLYYSNHFFKNNALFLQTGIICNYFTDYYMDAYDPILAEFYTQRDTKIGGFPRLDFFINFKVRQTRIFFKAEHFNSSFTGYNYFSAPNVPYRDFTVRFGLVWNFFL